MDVRLAHLLLLNSYPITEDGFWSKALSRNQVINNVIIKHKMCLLVWQHTVVIVIHGGAFVNIKATICYEAG